MNADQLPMILGAALLTYATRLTGFLLHGRTIPVQLDRFLGFVPVAVFAALVAQGFSGGSPDIAPRLLAVGIASITVIRFQRLWICLAVGMLAFWMLRGLGI
jgi:branched-subunit amino acid transport protein